MARSRVIRHMLAIAAEYDNEPEASESDEAAPGPHPRTGGVGTSIPRDSAYDQYAGERSERPLPGTLQPTYTRPCPYHGIAHWPDQELEGTIADSPFALCWMAEHHSLASATRMLYKGRISQDLFDAFHDFWHECQRDQPGRIVADGDGLRWLPRPNTTAHSDRREPDADETDKPS